jgi:hypothetical protein
VSGVLLQIGVVGERKMRSLHREWLVCVWIRELDWYEIAMMTLG